METNCDFCDRLQEKCLKIQFKIGSLLGLVLLQAQDFYTVLLC